jgi:hydroxyacyl-ACP dehydratase HTD2-like protein with hotdog domain
MPPADVTAVQTVPTRLQLFMFSAATWNAHRIHYDPDHARDEGYPDILVQSHLHASFLLQALRHTVGPEARITRFAFDNRAFALPGERLTCRGSLVSSGSTPDGLEATYDLDEVNEKGDVCVWGSATVLLPEEG